MLIKWKRPDEFASRTRPTPGPVLNHHRSKTLFAEFIRPKNIVTKLYDPLYYDFDEDHADLFANCDAAFSHETLV
ncbi:hypothetical protein F4776DRAFT_613524 [Hypoxylon sp. NC0597]|nr:hypothetical protein F4776DRAFT_613524 [Hypoxylon sp. NC0597]